MKNLIKKSQENLNKKSGKSQKRSEIFSLLDLGHLG